MTGTKKQAADDWRNPFFVNPLKFDMCVSSATSLIMWKKKRFNLDVWFALKHRGKEANRQTDKQTNKQTNKAR